MLFILLLAACGQTTAPAAQTTSSQSAAADDAAFTAVEAPETSSVAASTEDTAASSSEAVAEESAADGTSSEEAASSRQTVPIYDFTLKDQFGETHTLSEYEGKVVFLNFWATWCPPCRKEMPDIQALHEKYASEADPEVVILGVASPGLGGEEDEAGIAAFLSENGYTYPVCMDTTGEIMAAYGISSIPTTFMIDRTSHVYGYVSGMLDQATMQRIIDETLEAVP